LSNVTGTFIRHEQNVVSVTICLSLVDSSFIASSNTNVLASKRTIC